MGTVDAILIVRMIQYNIIPRIAGRTTPYQKFGSFNEEIRSKIISRNRRRRRDLVYGIIFYRTLY